MNFSTSYQLLVLALVSTIASSYTDGWAGDGNEVIDQTFCGAGVVGNGVCEIVVDENGVALEPCCSIAGFCGYGLAYCGETGEGGGEGYCEIDPAIAGACLTEGECCSEFGFCSTQFCGEGSGGAGGGAWPGEGEGREMNHPSLQGRAQERECEWVCEAAGLRGSGHR